MLYEAKSGELMWARASTYISCYWIRPLDTREVVGLDLSLPAHGILAWPIWNTEKKQRQSGVGHKPHQLILLRGLWDIQRSSFGIGSISINPLLTNLTHLGYREQTDN